jgi:hypothetical protein
MCKTSPNVPAGTFHRFETSKVFLQEHFLMKTNWNTRRSVPAETFSESVIMRGAGAILATPDFGPSVPTGTLRWIGSCDTQESVLARQVASTRNSIDTRNVPAGTFVLFGQLSGCSVPKLGSVAKLEKCSCRNIVENSSQICCQYRQIISFSHFMPP